MNTDLESRLQALRLEQWPEPPAGTSVPAVIPARGAVQVTGVGQTRGVEVLVGLADLMTRVLDETRALRDDIQDLRVVTSPAEEQTTVRERLLETQARELTGRVAALTREMDLLRSAAEQRERELLERARRERMRNFSD